MFEKKWQVLGIVSLAFTMIIGVIFRLQFAMIIINGIQHFNLRQFHTHLGFYGALGALASIYVFSKAESKRKTQSLFWLYVILLGATALGFLYDGYNLFTKISSFAVLLFWIYFSFTKLRSTTGAEKQWTLVSLSSLIFSISLLGLTIYRARQQDPISINQAVQGFLLVILLGHFTAISFNNLGFQLKRASVFFSLVVLTALGHALFKEYEISKIFYSLIGLFLMYLVLEKLNSLPRKLEFFFSPPNIAWTIFLIFFTVIPWTPLFDSRLIALSGLHFWILGPLMLSLIPFNNQFSQWIHFGLISGFATTMAILEPMLFEHSETTYRLAHLQIATFGLLALTTILIDQFIVPKKMATQR